MASNKTSARKRSSRSVAKLGSARVGSAKSGSAKSEPAELEAQENYSPDAWLDEAAQRDVNLPERPQSGRFRAFISRLSKGPFRQVSRVYSFLTTTPGMMAGVTLLLSIAIIAAGYSMSHSSSQRQEGLNTMLTETEPLNYAAHNVYTNLALADATASSGFVRAGVDSQQSLEAYYQTIDMAALAATESATGIDLSEPRTAELVSTIVRQLPVYTGMVETARTNSRQGNPVAVTYMSNASALMREELLPAAEELFSITSQNVDNKQQRLTTPQWVPLSGLFAALFFLFLAQYWLWRKTRRRLNRGFLVASAFMAVAILWVSVSNFATYQAGERAFQDASAPWNSLTAARILAQEVQTNETLTLVNRESFDPEDERFQLLTTSVHSALEDVEHAVETNRLGDHSSAETRTDEQVLATVSRARGALDDWTQAHTQLRQALESGDYNHATVLGTGTDEGQEVTSALAAAELDAALTELIDDARTSMRIFIAAGLAATQLVATSVLLLTFGAMISVWAGIRPRLQEYL